MKVVKVEHIHHETAVPVYDIINAAPYHNFLLQGETTRFVSSNCVIFDECNFSAAGIQDISKAKKRMKAKYDTLVARVTGTFVKYGEVYGKLYVISSKNSDSDFMEEYIASQKAANNPHMYIFDKPQWEVWPRSKYSSDKMFKVALGGKHMRSFVLSDDQMNEDTLVDLSKQGYTFLDVPEDNKTRFLADLDVALRDIAGISVPGSMSFISQESLDSCISVSRRNPFHSDIISIGTKDSYTIEEFFHEDDVDARLRASPVFIHLDLSLTTDRTGISGICISGRSDSQDGSGKVSLPTFSHLFSVALEAPRGDKIPYSKILDFLVWLRSHKFNIHTISRDQFQSEYLAQLLESKQFNVSKLSLDRTPDGYMALRSVLLEQRIDMLHCELLESELIHLQRDSVTGKVDHLIGQSKDVSDSFAGAIWNAILQCPGVPINSMSVAKAISSVNKSSRSYDTALNSIFPNNFKKY